MTRPLFYFCVALLLLPFGVKLGVPTWVPLAEHLERQFSQSSTPRDTVERVRGEVWTLRASDQSQQQVTLAGIMPIDSKWQAQANGVIAILLQSSHQQVDLTITQAIGKGEVARAIAQLPNGTSIQQVLVADGLTKLDKTQLSQLPDEVRNALQQAQTSAQQQRKNIWG
ncbi:thermonuclease family protein (plasmid) [Phormidium sp. CLA17]|uniref:thermonuclease family protein n=1 Tax=Leptolyngbya sp. Cla-17 TaxID=2803751 RepID=UPI0014926642|nr:thermonuclease family protein [Leptolyngbya sp. Cla-17]MBM0744916.1 thermonuclease family protein [Leptolyngbya sp. Cla-17]